MRKKYWRPCTFVIKRSWTIPHAVNMIFPRKLHYAIELGSFSAMFDDTGSGVQVTQLEAMIEGVLGEIDCRTSFFSIPFLN